ncbi:8-amino-7-oxononanoate synthase [Cycloclasticus sp. P1]|uniref:8-amino-7-oxononanoate synthase n=1 Tax=Cycloclasticus sp. (strain P1) TaxID=385025 RepID=UPI000286A98E|nr:8-amino-7-oxononanoate synthase [Cycloclasticus sp. P1]AFT67858.1 8-amino-7-oxononanoate synthase [Cycloclasticus sp. P1]
MDPWELATKLDDLKRLQRYRLRKTIESPQGASVQMAGQMFDNFSSNDYLGLANHPSVIKAFQQAAERYGVGSGSAHLICGHSAEHHALEEELAEFTGRDRALIFSTGYMANLGAISAMAHKGDEIFQDKLNHASLIDGGRLSGAQVKRFVHGDMGQLKQLLEGSSTRRKLVVSDGVFSMDGDEANMQGLVGLTETSNAMLMIDDAHGLGVLGEKGGGLLEACDLNQQQVPILMATLGKGLGTSGAFVAGSEELIETLIQQARTYVFTTAMPSAVMAATRQSLKICQQETWRREKLRHLVARFRKGAEQLGLNLMPSQTPIQPIILGSNEAVMAAGEYLKEKGILVGAIRYPAVKKASERLRITLSATHTDSQVDNLLLGLEELFC